MSPLVTVTQIEDGLCQVTMDDGRENHLGYELIDALTSVLESLHTQSSLKVVILAGRQDVFCSGGTLQLLQDMASGAYDEKRLLGILDRMLQLPVPIVGAVEGHAVGGGLALALACDVLFLGETSRYSANSADLGFTPAMGLTYLLPALVGHQFASEMIYTAKYYKGSELTARCKLNSAVPNCDVMSKALDTAQRISEKPRYVLELAKSSLSLPKRLALQEAATHEPMMHRICFTHPETAGRLASDYLG
jgi:polyketide biosynthesis enoyl-CoA hydratase PksI